VQEINRCGKHGFCYLAFTETTVTMLLVWQSLEPPDLTAFLTSLFPLSKQGK